MPHFCFITGLYSRYDVLMFERQGKSLVKAGFKVTYVVCDDKPNEFLDGINIVSTGFRPQNRKDRFFRTRKVLLEKSLSVDADVYQISDPELIGLVSAFKCRRKSVIFNLREYYPDMLLGKDYIPAVFRKVMSVGYSQLMKRKLKQYDAVFVVTDWILNLLRDKYKLDNAYLLANFPVVDNTYVLSKEAYMQRPDTLCYEGTIYASSRQENVFKALTNLPNVHYVIAGKIGEGYEWIKKEAYWERVEFIDGFKSSELEKVFAKATISNVFRDFGKRDGSLGVLKVFESMAAALPVLFADVPIYQRINQKYHCGICVDPNDDKTIYEAIKYLVENKEQAYEMGQNGRKAVISEYNWEKQAELYVEVIIRIVQK